MDEFAMIMGGFFVIWLVLILFALTVGILTYVLSSLGAYRIAKRRGIHNPWLAWLPVGQAWILGSISDHYQYVARGKTRNYRKVLLWMEAGVMALAIMMSIVSVVMSVTGVVAGMSGSEDAAILGMMGTLGIMMIVYLLLIGVCITYSVFCYICYYDLFRSCKPDNAVLFLVLSIFVSITLPIFIFVCSKHDEGMPPKIRSTVNG